MNNINIFISSTCYDLAQIRVDISEFINNSGHNPILSEFENFPITPELNTIENCIKIVKDNADILVLIVGNRYGSIIDNGKSITNNEFLVAKKKGIPIFCFIDKTTLNALSFWRKNKEGDFSDIVDNTQIFEFIDDIRNNSKIWTFPFDKAQDIISTLKIQLSYLFKDSLKAKNKIDEKISDFFQLNLSDKALKIIIEENTMFEYMFLAQVFVDEIQKNEFLKNDIEYSILTEPKHTVNDLNDIPIWAGERLATAQNLIGGFSSLVNDALIKFLNEPGKPADLKGLYYVALKYSQLYKSLLNWSIETKSTYIDEEYNHIKMDLSELILKPSEQIWNFPFRIKEQLKQAKEKVLNGEKDISLEFKLTLEMDENVLDRVNANTRELGNLMM
ncbi:DUF4062 domain-containing protein [Zobellia uliginosa]|uniref:DUF4062 domain-containing protein n=1 Tax=Zobellia uliginosa TaxID=143224 RepID=UPI001C078F77|nr:DUF4062 domain-containing protein [Zobellia uliginosa]MBU2947030.1 DUF4062 domain-containing protein [Zobellia uliginosa]